MGEYKKGPAIYKGKFHDQAMQGEYVVTWENGIQYEGLIEDNKLHGAGTMTFNDGNIKTIQGVW